MLFLVITVNATPWERSSDQRTYLPEKLAKGSKDWNFDWGLGYTQYSGNIEQTNANTEFTYFRQCGKDSFYINSGFMYGLSKDVVTQNQGRLAFRYDWPVNENFKWFAFNTHAYNEFLKLYYRGTVGAGPWYDFLGEGWKNGISIAPAYFHETFKDYGSEKELWISLRNVFNYKISDTAGFGFDSFFMFRSNDPEDQLTFLQPFLETVIKPDKFSLKLSYLYEGDTRPKPGVKSTDSTYLATLMMHFGE